MRPNIGPMTIRIASCSCGALTARCAGDPVRVSVCHCLACQIYTDAALAELTIRMPGGARNMMGR